MDKYFKRYLASFMICLVFFAGLYLYLFKLQLGQPIEAEWWVKRSLDYKEYRAEQINKEKIIIAGGSNALFGIESTMIEKFTAYPVVNMAAHVQLDLEYIYMLLQPHINEGDIVILSLEFEQIRRRYELSDWFARNMVAWGEETYLSNLRTLDYLTFVAKTPKKIIWDSLQASNGASKLVDKKIVINNVLENNQPPRGPMFDVYTHFSLNHHGDILAEHPPRSKVVNIAKKKGDNYYTAKDNISPLFLEHYRKIQKLVKSKGGRLILTWPVTIRNKLFDMSVKEHQENIAYLVNQLKEEGIEMACEPGLFNLSYELFSNSRYHLSAKGARLRSIVLGDCIRNMLSNKPVEDLEDDFVASKVKQLESKIIGMKYPLPK